LPDKLTITMTDSNTPSRIVVGRRRPEDTEALDRIYVEVFGAEASRESLERWQWQYERNPHCPAEGPDIWVAREDGHVLGQYASMSVRLKVKDRIVPASWGMDVMVKPGLQRKGVGTRLFNYWDEHVEAPLGLGLSVSSYALFRKLGWEDVGPVPCYTRILDPTAPLARRFGPLPAGILAPFVRAALGLLHPPRRSDSDVEVAPVEGSFGDVFDRLWDKASPGYDFLAERTSRYLEWKYREIPYVTYDVFQALRGGELVGYQVLRATVKNGVKLGLLVDWLAHPDDASAVDALIDHAADWGRKNGVARLQTFTFDRRLGVRLKKRGFYRIKSPMQFCLHIHSDHVDRSFFRDTSRWHVTFGDSDQDREA